MADTKTSAPVADEKVVNEARFNQAKESYNTVISRERLSGFLWLIWSAVCLAGGIVWNVLFNKTIDDRKAAFEADWVEGARTWIQHSATIRFFYWLLIVVGVLALLMAISRLVYAWDMKRDPVGIYSHYQMRLRGRIAFLILGFGGGTLISVYDILTRKFVIDHREDLIIVVNRHLAGN